MIDGICGCGAANKYTLSKFDTHDGFNERDFYDSVTKSGIITKRIFVA